MRTKQEMNQWLLRLLHQNITQPSEELINPAELSNEDVRALYATICIKELLNVVATSRDQDTNKIFFSWFFQFADRLPVAEVLKLFANRFYNKQNVLRLLFVNNDTHSIALLMAWATPLLKESKIQPNRLFELLSQIGEYYELEYGSFTRRFLVYLVDQRRDLFIMLMNWMSELAAYDSYAVKEAIVTVLQLRSYYSLLDETLSVKDEQSLKSYLLLIQSLFDSEKVNSLSLLELIYRVNEPGYYTKNLAAYSPLLKQRYENLVGELLFVCVQNRGQNQLKNRFEALCKLQPVEPIKIKDLTLSDEEIRPLLLKYIDRLPPNERLDAFEKALDKSHPFGTFMLQKGWFSKASDDAFEEKINLMSRWSTQSIRGSLKAGSRPMHAVLYQPAPSPSPVAVSNEQRIVMQMNH